MRQTFHNVLSHLNGWDEKMPAIINPKILVVDLFSMFLCLRHTLTKLRMILSEYQIVNQFFIYTIVLA